MTTKQPPGQEIQVVSYERISDDGENDAHGVRDQRRVNAATAKRLGWTVVHHFTDNDRSASKADVTRESFETMIRALRAGHLLDGSPIRGVVVVADDRLARRAGDYERFVEALTSKEGRVYADERGAKDLYSEDVEGLGLVGVAFSKIESRKVRRRIRRWHQARAVDGKPAGGTRPFGWRVDDRSRIEPTEAAHLARAVDEVIAGRSLNSIVKEWRTLDLRTSLGNLWSARTLKLALNNPRLCGWRRLGDDLVRDADGNPVVGTWTPIVSPERWLAVHAIIEARRGMATDKHGVASHPLPQDFRDHKYLLTGILRCGRTRADGSVCGARLRVVQNQNCVQHIYACPPKTHGGCAGVGRRGDKVDGYITEAVLAKLEERAALPTREDSWSGEPELQRLEVKLSALRQQWTLDQISDGLFFSTARQIEDRLRDLRNEQARHVATAARAASGFADVRGRWHRGEIDLSQKRAFIREALHAVIVRPVVRKGRSPFDPHLLEPVWRE